MEFITAFLNNTQNDDDISNGTELMKLYGVKMSNPRWGVSKGGFFFDRENRTVYKGMSSIKYIGEAVSNDLFALSQTKQYTYFMELLADLDEQTNLDSRQLDLLIKIDFFKEFGNQRELFKLVEIFGMFKITKIRNFYDVMGYLGYTSGKEEDWKKLYVTGVKPLYRKKDNKLFGYSLFTKSIGSGKESRFTVFCRVFDKYPVKEGGIVYCKAWERDGTYFKLLDYEKIY